MGDRKPERVPVRSDVVEQATRDKLEKRGVTIESIAQIVYDLQLPFNEDLHMEDCMDSVNKVLQKREIQHAVLVGIELDELAEKKQLSQPLQEIVESDEGLFGVDETIAFGSVFGYGSIAVTTFGYLDKEKVGIIKELDTKKGEEVNTFLDDLVCSIAANASGRLAHRLRDRQEKLQEQEIIDKDREERIG